MALGETLFVLAMLGVFGSTVIGLIVGLAIMVSAKLNGRPLTPQPEPGSPEWVSYSSTTRVDTAKKSLLTEWSEHTARDPVVSLAGVRYRITRLGGARFLVTHVAEGRRVGTFELDGNGRNQEVLPEGDDPASSKLLIQIAVLSSLVRRDAA